MKKYLMLALCALSLGIVSCDKEKEGDDGQGYKEGTILAKVQDNEVFINGKSYGLTEGYAQVENDEYCILDFGTENNGNDEFGRGIIQGTYLNKEVDLAKVNTEELFIDIIISLPKNSRYEVHIVKNEEMFESLEGLFLDEDEWKPENGKSCFKAGKLKGEMKDKDTVLVTAEGITNSGKEFAIKILYPINQW